jgi:hypothetical protein
MPRRAWSCREGDDDVRRTAWDDHVHPGWKRCGSQTSGPCGAGRIREGGTGRRRRWRPTPSSDQPSRVIRSGCCSARPRPASPTWSRSATAACWCPRSPSTGARPWSWPPTCTPPRHQDSRSRCVAMRTCPTSVPTPHPSAAWSSTSTTLTRPYPAPSNGTSSDWPPAWSWPDGTTASPTSKAARRPWPRWRATARPCGASPLRRSWRSGMPTSTSRTPWPPTGPRSRVES